MGEKTSIGLYINQSVLDDIEQAIRKTNCTSRNEFITEAIRHYIVFLSRKDYSDLLTPAYESVVGAKIADSENHIASVLFKQGVELAMLMHVIAASYDIDEMDLSKLRKLCVEEVSRNSGKYKFDDAVHFQRG